MDRTKLFSLISGPATILYGYRLLAVSPDLPFEQVIISAEAGMLLVLAGGVILMFGILRRT